MAITQLLLLDDHTLFRVMLRSLLETESDFKVVAQCSRIDDALVVLKQYHVDMVLLDYDLGNRQTGLQFIAQARQAGYASRIFMLTAGMTDADYVAALGYGICGIFLKHNSPDLLIEAINKVMAGQTWIDQHCIRTLAKSLNTESAERRSNELTDRERQVLKGVFAGASNKQIGSDLGISEASVKSALQQLFTKTGVRTRSQLVRVALEDYGGIWNSKV